MRTYMVVVVVRLFNHSFPACAFFFLKWRLARAHYFFLYVRIRISPLSELRRLWPNVPRQLHVSSFPDRFPHSVWTAA